MLLAEQGLAGAQYNLGLMYANGIGVPQNYAEAVSWYRLAAVRCSDIDAFANRGVTLLRVTTVNGSGCGSRRLVDP